MKTITQLLRRVLTVLSVGILLCMSSGGIVAAQDKKEESKDKPAAVTQTQGTVQAHSASQAMQPGTLVRLDGEGTSKVTAATFDKASQMYGVVVTGDGLPLTVTSAALENNVYVGTTGTYDVLVSTQNGPVKSGDYVTISSVEGIAMVAEPEQATVFGRAAGSFDGKTNIVGNTTLKDKSGKELKKVAIGKVPVVIDIRDNPKEKSTKANVPEVLQRLGEAVAEKPIGPLRMYLSIGITGISIIAAIVILYSGVRSSLISIGRNPLSKKTIGRALVEIILTSLIILIIGLFAVYLLLKL